MYKINEFIAEATAKHKWLSAPDQAHSDGNMDKTHLLHLKTLKNMCLALNSPSQQKQEATEERKCVILNLKIIHWFYCGQFSLILDPHSAVFQLMEPVFVAQYKNISESQSAVRFFLTAAPDPSVQPSLCLYMSISESFF